MRTVTEGCKLPKVSVIIPCYNQEEFLEDAILSVYGDYKDFEIIVINDGSKNSAAITEICEKFKCVKLINQNNQGVCAARNNAISQAYGEYILPLDADDLIKNEYLKLAGELLDKNKDIGIVYCDAKLFGDRNGKWKLKKASTINMLIQNRIFNCAMFRKSDFDKVGGYNLEMKEGCEDWDFWLSLMETGLKPFKINQTLFSYRQHKLSRTRKAMKNYLTIRKKIIKNHKKLYLKYNFLVLLPMAARIIKELICPK